MFFLHSNHKILQPIITKTEWIPQQKLLNDRGMVFRHIFYNQCVTRVKGHQFLGA